jgi:putative DNA primase/helicase
MISVPEELQRARQWVCYDGRKVPKQVTGINAKPTDPDTWNTFDAVSKAASHFNGIGFALLKGDGLVCIDLDHVIDEDGCIEAWALDIIKRLDSYTEISPSGSGIHVWVRAEKFGGRCRNRRIEIYDGEHYMTVTGNRYPGTPPGINDAQDAVNELYAEHFPEAPKQAAPAPSRPVDLSDQDLISIALTFGNGAAFDRLYNQGDPGGDHSGADLALCNMLAFLTGNDPARMDRLFRGSALYREKWERDDYRRRTIETAIAATTETYSGNGHRPSPAVAPVAPKPEPPPAPKQDMAHTNLTRLTEYTNAERMATAYGEDIRYCHKWKAWIVWNGKHWERDEDSRVWQLAMKTVMSMYREAADTEAEGQRRSLVKHALGSESANKIKALLTHAMNLERLVATPILFDSNQWLLNCQNGTLNIETGILQKHNRLDYITNVIPVEYDAEAICPVWGEFLQRIMDGNQELIDFLQKVIGYTLTGCTREQVFFILYGSGANGKSTLLAIIRELLAGYAKRVRTESLMSTKSDRVPTDLADLAGARFVSAVETDEGQRLAESQLKQLTGDSDGIKVRRLYEREFEYIPTYKLFLACNHKPTIKGTDLAIWRRIRLIPFSVSIPEAEQDKGLLDKLRAELPGILAWAVKGAWDWSKLGLWSPEDVTSATRAYRDDMDVIGSFLDEYCIMDNTARTRSGEIYQGYTAWSLRAGERPMTQRALSNVLKERGFEVYMSHGSRYWRGLELREMVAQVAQTNQESESLL